MGKRANSEWRIVFLEGSVPALLKNFGSSGDETSSSLTYCHAFGSYGKAMLQNSLPTTD
jgi:hypothetical protein